MPRGGNPSKISRQYKTHSFSCCRPPVWRTAIPRLSLPLLPLGAMGAQFSTPLGAILHWRIQGFQGRSWRREVSQPLGQSDSSELQKSQWRDSLLLTFSREISFHFVYFKSQSHFQEESFCMDIFSLGEEDFVPFCIFYHSSRKSRFVWIFLV